MTGKWEYNFFFFITIKKHDHHVICNKNQSGKKLRILFIKTLSYRTKIKI